MTEPIKPKNEDEVQDAVRWAVAGETPLEITGGASKRALGPPAAAKTRLDLSALSGITLYEPEELVLAAAAATPLAEIEAELAKHNQNLAFEPQDLGSLLGAAANHADILAGISAGISGGVLGGTLGGAVACNLTGPRRIKAGSARDHVLGFRAVSGRGEIFKSGGRVVKNVTGFDLSKLITGSFGTLAVMTSVTVKVLPAAEKTRTVLIIDADDAAATEIMAAALNSAFEVSAAAHLPAAAAAASGVDTVAAAGAAVTAIRLEGPAPSVEYRCRALKDLFREQNKDRGVEELHSANSAAFWRQVRDVWCFAAKADAAVWRLSVPPAEGWRVAAEILAQTGGQVFYDWGGGLVWLAVEGQDDAGHQMVRAAVDRTGGHATLIRAPADVRAAVPVFHPQSEGVAALSARIKDAFDPKNILNPGRMGPGIGAGP